MYVTLPRWAAQSALAVVFVGALNVLFSAPAVVSGYEPQQANGTSKSSKPKTTCAVNNGGCDAGVACLDSAAGAFCGKCPTGYTTNGSSCEDINECLKDNGGCDPRTSCRNTAGSHLCGECPDGFSGDGYSGCTDVNETAKQDDVMPPVVKTDGDVTVPAASADGAVVKFTATATDAIDGARPVTCKPASGSTFALGTTTVTCAASDTQGNRGTATFKVTVSRP